MIKQQKFSIRKYSVGVASVVIGSLLFGANGVLAEEMTRDNVVVTNTEISNPELKETTDTASEETYTIEEIEATKLWDDPSEYSLNPSEYDLLEDTMKVARQELYSGMLTYESEKAVGGLIEDLLHLGDEYIGDLSELHYNDVDGKNVDGKKKLDEQYALKRLEKAKEIENAIQTNPIRKQYSALKDRAFYELNVENPGWSYESYTHLKTVYDEVLEVEKMVADELKYSRKDQRVGKYMGGLNLHMPVEIVAPLSNEVMESLSKKLEDALDQLSVDAERQKLVDAYNELKKVDPRYKKYTYESHQKVVEALKELDAQDEPQPKDYQAYMQRLVEIKRMLVEKTEEKHAATVFLELDRYASNLNLAFATEKSLNDLALAREQANKLWVEDTKAAIAILQKAIDDFELLPNNPQFSNEVIKKITIEKDKVDLRQDEFITVQVEMHPNSSGEEWVLGVSLLDQSPEDWPFSTKHRQKPIKKEGNVYTFVLPLYNFEYNGKYAMNLEYFENDEYGKRKIASKVPYTLDVQGGYNFSKNENQKFIKDTNLNSHEFKLGDIVLFKAMVPSMKVDENALFDIYKVGESTPVKRIRSTILGNNARTEALANAYYRQVGNKGMVLIEDLYSAFKIDDTFTEGEYEIRPADLTDTTMKDRLTLEFDMLDRYVQRFKVVKPHKEHIVLEGTTEKDGVYTFADNDRSTDVKVKVDKNIAEAKNIFALQVEAFDGDLPVLGGKAYRAFEVDFIDRDGKVIKFSDAHARVYIPVKEEVVAAYHIKGNSKEAVPFVMSEDKQGVWIDVEHFSTYAIEFASAVSPKPTDDDHKVTDLDKNPKPSEGDTQTPPKADGENQATPTPQPNGNALVTPGSNGPTTPSQPTTPSKPEAKPAQPIAKPKPKPKADTAEKPQEAPQPSATANTTVAAPSAPAAVAQATPAPKGETLPETGEASTAWFTLASVAVLASLGLVATKRPEDI